MSNRTRFFRGGGATKPPRMRWAYYSPVAVLHDGKREQKRTREETKNKRAVAGDSISISWYPRSRRWPLVRQCSRHGSHTQRRTCHGHSTSETQTTPKIRHHNSVQESKKIQKLVHVTSQVCCPTNTGGCRTAHHAHTVQQRAFTTSGCFPAYNGLAHSGPIYGSR